MPVIKNALTPINHRAGGCTPKWIVVHYFGALGSAASVAEWFKNPQARASAHYAVDEGDIIYRCVRESDVAWHCGDGTLHPECRNWNSIGVELRPKKVNPKRMGAYDTDWFFEKKVLDNAEWLIRKLMEEHNIPADHIIRHYDVSGKYCPRPFVGADMNTYYHTTGNEQWKKFLERFEDEVVEKSKMIVLPCDCKCCMLVIEKTVWEDNDVSYNISIQDSRYDHNYNTVWGRIKRAVKILFGKPIYYNDLHLEGEEKFHKLVGDMEELERLEYAGGEGQ